MPKSTLPITFSKTKNKIHIEISKNELESFMNTCGLFKKEFLDILKQSEKDHKAGRITKRKNLKELINS